MVFSSLPFLFVFLPVFLIVYYLLPGRYRNAWLFLGSAAFYYYGIREHWSYLFLFLGQIATGYFCGRQMETGRRKKLWLTAGLTVNFGMLFFFKYAGFFAHVCNGVLAWFTAARIPEAAPELPVGISFYTFQIASYVIDVFRGKISAEKSPIRFGAYVSMFPQLIAWWKVSTIASSCLTVASLSLVSTI